MLRLPLADPEFVRVDGGWVLELPPTGLARLEYKLELLGHDGDIMVVCDPGNPQRAPGAFGEKSVLMAPGYRAPGWLDVTGPPATFDELGVRVLGRDLAIRVWSPAGGRLPLLVAHDGPEYDELAALTRYAGAMIASDALPPFRVALLPPGDRNEWYSASALYGRALCRADPAGDRRSRRGRRSPRRHGREPGSTGDAPGPADLAGHVRGAVPPVGSFFIPRFDRQESGFPRYRRIVTFVRGVIRATLDPEPVPASMTCGTGEENIHNNRLMAAALGAQGYGATLAEVPDLHNYTGWRDALHPHLTRLLAGVWAPR